jgi:hypothetical protein
MAVMSRSAKSAKPTVAVNPSRTSDYSRWLALPALTGLWPILAACVAAFPKPPFVKLAAIYSDKRSNKSDFVILSDLPKSIVSLE